MNATGNNEDNLRELDYDRDLPAVQRIWREVGWIDSDYGEQQLARFLKGGSTLVGTIGANFGIALR